jgi:SAM-dependent methyltransferase
MTSPGSDDAVGFFSENAAMFHDLYQKQPEFHERVSIWNELLDKYANPRGTALDMGCGPGVFTFYLAPRVRSIVGVDGAPEMLERCERQRQQLAAHNVRFVHARLPLAPQLQLEAADLVISSSVVEYVDDLELTLAQFCGLLKPGGTLILSMPNLASVSRSFQRLKFKLTGEPDVYRYIQHFSLPFLLRRRLERHGLSLLESRFYTHATRLAKLGRALRWPRMLTEDLFVAVFRKA